jgi:hypothetical protein
MQSQYTPILRGFGSAQLRGRVYWLVYRGLDGSRIQENSHTTDKAEAEHMLAGYFITDLQARLARLTDLYYGGTKDSSAEARPAQGRVDRPAQRRRSAGTKSQVNRNHPTRHKA